MSFLQLSGKKLHIVNTRLHSASAESKWSFATALNWSSSETLGSYINTKFWTKNWFPGNTHIKCTYLSYCKRSPYLCLGAFFLLFTRKNFTGFSKKPRADAVPAGMLSLLHSKQVSKLRGRNL